MFQAGEVEAGHAAGERLNAQAEQRGAPPGPTASARLQHAPLGQVQQVQPVAAQQACACSALVTA